jgi:hypothetical protein
MDENRFIGPATRPRALGLLILAMSPAAGSGDPAYNNGAVLQARCPHRAAHADSSGQEV